MTRRDALIPTQSIVTSDYFPPFSRFHALRGREPGELQSRGGEGDGGDCRQETQKNREVFLGNLLRPLLVSRSHALCGREPGRLTAANAAV
jgi:hypothetical protein